MSRLAVGFAAIIAITLAAWVVGVALNHYADIPISNGMLIVQSGALGWFVAMALDR